MRKEYFNSMTDERYLFMQDIKEKNRTKSGAYHKRSGAKSKYVGLPQDHMTAAELKRRNGPVKTYSINTCIRDWKTFKELPADLAREYMIRMRDVYSARATKVAESMGVNPITLRKHLLDLGISLGKGGRYNLSPAWPDFLDGKLDSKGAPLSPVIPEPETTVTVTAIEPITIDKPVLIAKPEVNPYRVTLSLLGTPAQLADLIAVLTDSTTEYNFEVTITGKGVA